MQVVPLTVSSPFRIRSDNTLGALDEMVESDGSESGDEDEGRVVDGSYDLQSHNDREGVLSSSEEEEEMYEVEIERLDGEEGDSGKEQMSEVSDSSCC